MAGVIAGSMTKSNTLGVVGSIPFRGDPQHQQLHDGCAEREPEDQDQGGLGQQWFNPPKEPRPRESSINSGADVLFQNTDSSAVLQTASKNKVRLRLGQRHERLFARSAPRLVGDRWGPYYIKARVTLEGQLEGQPGLVVGRQEGAIDIVSISDKVPAELKAKGRR